MPAPLLETQALPAQAARGPGAASAAQRAPGPRSRGEADARLRAGRLRQDDAARRVAGAEAAGGSGRGLALARRGRQRPGVLLDLRGRRAADGGAGRRRDALALLATPQPPPIERLLTTLLNDLGATGGDIVLVLDDYHVIDAREVHDAMAFLLDHLPPRLHLVIASRADPALPLARLRARGELVEVRAADLRFTPEEAAAYLNGVDGPAAHRPRRGRAGGTHRGLDRRAPAGRALDAGPRRRRPASSPGSPATTATSSTTWPRRCCSASPDRSATSCCTPPPRPAHRPAVRRRHRARGRQGACSRRSTAATCSWSRSTTAASGTATTTCSPTCCRPGWPRSHPEVVPALHRRASDWYAEHGETGRGDRARAGRRGLRAGGRPGGAAMPGAAQGPAGGRRCAAGSSCCPTRSLRVRPVLSNGFAGALLATGEFEGVERHLRDARALARPRQPGRSQPPGWSSSTRRSSAGSRPAIAVHRAGLALVHG